MAEAADAPGFSEAMELVRRLRPPGYEYLLTNRSRLQSAFHSGLDEGESSPYFIGFEQFETASVYAALVTIAGQSDRLGRFKQPCCSEWPLTWPVCNRSC